MLEHRVGGCVPDFEVIRFKLDSGVCVIDHALLQDWIIEQISKLPGKFEYVEGWQDEELGTDPEDVVIPSSLDSVFHLNDPVNTLQLVATLLISSIPGLEEEDSNWDVDWDKGGS
jgi:hypothetical protein